MPVHIREIRLDDAQAFLQLQKILDEETSFMLLEAGERTTEVEDVANKIRDVLAQDNRAILVAEADGELIGLMELIGGNVRRNRHTAYIVIGIRQAYTGKGVGSRLFAEGEAWARRHGIHRLELTVMIHNRGAVALYKKMGFQIEGSKRHSLLVEGRYVDEYYMAKLLD